MKILLHETSQHWKLKVVKNILSEYFPEFLVGGGGGATPGGEIEQDSPDCVQTRLKDLVYWEEERGNKKKNY